MAGNPLSGVYNGGAVVFNTQPIAQYYSQMLQHKQAKDEALGRYYQDLGKNINGAGMRTQDIENGWNQKVNDWQNFYNQNADAIKYPQKYGATAQNEFYARYRDILNDVDRSKEAGKNEAMVREKMLDPKWREQSTDQDLGIAQNMSRPIYDPQHYKDGHTTPYGPEDFSFNAPKFDLNQQKGALNYLTQGLPRSESPHPTQGPVVDQRARTVTVPMIASYDKPTYDKIIERGVDIYHSGPSAQRFFENELHNPADLQTLNGPFKQYTGKDISSPEDVARAWALSKVPQTVPGKDKVRGWNDPEAALYRQEAFYDYREKEKQKKATAEDDAVESHLQKLEANGKPLDYKTASGDHINTKVINFVPEEKKIFTIRRGAHLVDPDEIRYNPETKDYMGVFWQRDSGGKPILINGRHATSDVLPTQIYDRESVKAGLAKILPKRADKQLQGGASSAPTPSPEDNQRAADLLKKYLGQ